MILALLACAAPLLPGEQVLGDDLMAMTLEGAARAELGTCVAISDLGLLVTGRDEARVLDLDGAERVRIEASDLGGCWWIDGEPVVFQRGVGVVSVDEPSILRVSLPGATAAAPCPDGRWESVDGPGEAVACGEAGVLTIRCEPDGSCAAMRDQDTLADASAAGALGWLDGAACWGDPALEQPLAPGALCCETGGCWEGQVGDHLGVSLAGGRVAGVFNKSRVPARAVILSTEGDDTWVVDRAAERSRLALSSADGWWAVGVPGWQGHDARQGRVYWFQGDAP